MTKKIKEEDIFSNGILSPLAGPVNERHVEACERFIEIFLRPRRRINKAHSSYYLKHCVEYWLKGEGGGPGYRESHGGGYIGNGAFIVAAMRNGYRILPDDLNAYFNMDMTLLEQALPEIQSRFWQFFYAPSTKTEEQRKDSQ